MLGSLIGQPAGFGCGEHCRRTGTGVAGGTITGAGFGAGLGCGAVGFGVGYARRASIREGVRAAGNGLRPDRDPRRDLLLRHHYAPSLKQLIKLFKNPALLPTYAAIVINMFVVGVLFGFFPVYLHAIGYSTGTAGLIVSATTASYLLIQPFAGWLADRVDAGLTVIVGLAIAAGATLAIPAATGWPLIPLAILAGLGVGTVWTNTDMLVTKIAGDRQLGAAVGAAQSFKEVGDMLGPLAIGAIAQTWGVRVGFFACGGAALAVVALLAWRRPRVHAGTPATMQ